MHSMWYAMDWINDVFPYTNRWVICHSYPNQKKKMKTAYLICHIDGYVPHYCQRQVCCHRIDSCIVCCIVGSHCIECEVWQIKCHRLLLLKSPENIKERSFFLWATLCHYLNLWVGHIMSLCECFTLNVIPSTMKC